MNFLDSVQQWDINTLVGIQETLNADWLTPIMVAITKMGEVGIFAILLSLVLLIFKKTRRLGILCGISLLLCFIACNIVIKPAVGRVRPWVVSEAVHALLPPPGDSSFPSGHASNCIAAAFAMWINTLPVKTNGQKTWDGPSLGWNCAGADRKQMHNLSIIAVIMALLIAVSRLYLGMHFPTDVICGVLLGCVCATIVYAVDCRLRRKKL